MDIVKINDKIVEHENEILKLKTEAQEYHDLTVEQRVAEFLHSRFCRFNHTDGCGFYYENWEKPGYSRKEWLKKANSLLENFDEYEIKDFVLRFNGDR